MKTVAIIYFSKNGTTERLAKAVADGVENSPDCTAYLYQICSGDIVDGRFTDMHLFQKLSGCDAIIFGSPTYMGGVTAQFKALADASSESWSKQLWRNKLAAGFTIGGSPGGDLQHTLDYFKILASQHSMLWVGLDRPDGTGTDKINRYSGQTGVIATEESGEVAEVDINTAHYLGERVAALLNT